jgi:hypothetical protein
MKTLRVVFYGVQLQHLLALDGQFGAGGDPTYRDQSHNF